MQADVRRCAVIPFDSTETEIEPMTKYLTLPALTAIAATETAAAAATSGKLALGPATRTKQATHQAYYDGRKDSYLVTDVSNKARAKPMHVNYSAGLASAKRLPDQHFVNGKAASGQLSVFGSEPGESSYDPLWEEIFVT
jgi:hypothetical protein